MLRLRSYKQSDCVFLQKWITDDRFCHQFCANNFSYPLDELQMEKYYNLLCKSDTDFAFMAIDENEKVIGHIKIGKIDFEKNQGGLQFVIIEDSSRGKGYGKEMVRLAIEYAFQTLKLSQIFLTVFAFNKSAVDCYLSVGFKEMRYNKKGYPYNGELWDSIYMVLGRENWIQK